MLVTISARERKDPFFARDAELRGFADRADDQRRSHIDLVVRVHHFAIGQTDHAIFRCDCANLFGGERRVAPGEIVCGSNLAEA